jgi:hypothetical protein
VISRADALRFVMSVDKEIAETLGEESLVADVVDADTAQTAPHGGAEAASVSAPRGGPSNILWHKALRADRYTKPTVEQASRGEVAQIAKEIASRAFVNEYFAPVHPTTRAVRHHPIGGLPVSVYDVTRVNDGEDDVVTYVFGDSDLEVRVPRPRGAGWHKDAVGR